MAGFLFHCAAGLSGGNLAQSLVLASDESGRFTTAKSHAGKYNVRVVKANFGEGMMRLVQVAGNSTRKIAILVDRAPKKVGLNDYKEILER